MGVRGSEQRHFGRYRLVERLGSGATAVVYRARDEQLGRDVALKLIVPGGLSDAHARQALAKEARLLARLNHPNVEMVHDFGRHEDRDYLVVEYIPGVELRQLLEEGALDEAEVRSLGAQLADGLAAAHARGVIHRDVKPANLRITPEGRLKIIDFGIARVSRAAVTLTHVETQEDVLAVAGTPAYMAPEQLHGKADARTDIYAAGAVLYEMATGARPFAGGDLTQLVHDVLERDPRPPRKVNPALSEELEEIILRALRKDPAERFQSAAALRDALAGQSRARGARRGGAFFAAAAAALAVLLVAAGAGLWWMARRAARTPVAAERAPLAAPTLREQRLTALPDDTWVQMVVPTKDGRAFFWSNDDGIWRTPVGGGAPVEVPLPKGYSVYGVRGLASDGRLLANLASKSEPGRVNALVAPQDGTVEVLPLERATALGLSPDGRTLLVARESGLYLRQLGGTEEERVYGLSEAESRSTYQFAWSPDSRYFAVAVVQETERGFDGRIEIVSVDGRTARIPVATNLVQPWGLTGLAWRTAERLLYVRSADDASGVELWEVGVRDGAWDGGPPTRLFRWPGASVDWLQFAAGRLFFVKNAGRQNDVNVAALDASGRLADKVHRVSRYDGQDLVCGWSADGRVVFASDRYGTWDLFVQAPDATKADVLAGGPGAETCGATDGDATLFWRVAPGGTGPGECTLMRLEAGASEAKVVGTFGRARPNVPDRPMDCPLVMCSSKRCVLATREGNEGVLHKLNPVTGATERLWRRNISNLAGPLALSPDGREVAFALMGPPVISIADLATGRAREVPVKLDAENKFMLRDVAWLPDGSGWYATGTVSITPYGRQLLLIDREGKARTIWSPTFEIIESPVPSADGRRLALNVLAVDIDAWMLEGF